MPTPFKIIYLFISLFILSFSVAAHTKPFDIKNLLNAVPFDDVIENDEVSATQLHKRLHKNTKINTKINDTIWQLDKHNKSTIIFHNPHEKWVLKTYPISENKQLLLVNIQLGNHGQTQSFTFFIYDNSTNSLSEEIERKAYIPNITENDFLTKDHQFSNSEQSTAILHMNDDGTISASPQIWMNSKWENKEPEYSIKFKWTHSRFIKIKEKI